jgi:hypothetical protein
MFFDTYIHLRLCFANNNGSAVAIPLLSTIDPLTKWLSCLHTFFYQTLIGVFSVSLEKFCRVRGNLLFYFKTSDPFAGDGLPQGCIVLEKFHCKIYNDDKDHDGYAFFLGEYIHDYVSRYKWFSFVYFILFFF